jgi:hypothetical protein
MNSYRTHRRKFLKELAQDTGAIVLLPLSVSAGLNCKNSEKNNALDSLKASTTSPASIVSNVVEHEKSASEQVNILATLPSTKPNQWDPIAFNLQRGKAGAISASYLAKINGPDGIKNHLGKHLPYLPVLKRHAVPKGYLPIMWGDPWKGFARHPNAPENVEKNELGHWYNWIKVKKVNSDKTNKLAELTVESTSQFPAWPGDASRPQQRYSVFGQGDIKADGGRNTIYLVKLPAGVGPGDTVRIWAHCLQHGEYLDFLTLPEEKITSDAASDVQQTDKSDK